MTTTTTPTLEDLQVRRREAEQEIADAKAALGRALLDGTDDADEARESLNRAEATLKAISEAEAELGRRHDAEAAASAEQRLELERHAALRWRAEFLRRQLAVKRQQAKLAQAEEHFLDLGTCPLPEQSGTGTTDFEAGLVELFRGDLDLLRRIPVATTRQMPNRYSTPPPNLELANLDDEQAAAAIKTLEGLAAKVAERAGIER
jgi:hypothetical protein